jgi:serine/threonine-protein kinase
MSTAIPKSVGRYEIVGEVGRGAMGVVYKALDPNIGRTVALKTMRVDVHGADEEEILRRFKHEAKLAGTMSHPSIVTVHDAGEDSGVFFMAMEYLEGVTLHRVLKDKHVLPLPRVIEIAQHIATGLDYAHSHGVIHRDVKPANIMCATNGAIKIMDFGIAKSGAGMTSAGQVLGTPTYMSPEQVRGRQLDGRSDLFSFGVILYEMVTGEKPFSGQNVTTIIYKIMNEAPIPPRDLDTGVHPAVSAVILKALAKDPNERYQSGAELVRDLENYDGQRAAGNESAKIAVAASAAVSGGGDGNHPGATVTAFEMHADSGSQTVHSEPQTTTKMLGSEGGAGVEAPPMEHSQPRFVPNADAVLQSIENTVLVGNKEKKPHAPPPSKIVTTLKKKNFTVPAAAILLVAVILFGRAIKRPVPEPEPQPQPATTSPQPAPVQHSRAANVVTPTTALDTKPSAAKPTAPAATPASTTKPGAKANSTILVRSTPPGAVILLDQKKTGKVTPATLKVESGRHEITFSKDFYRPATMTPTLKDGETLNLAPVLEAEKSGHGIKGIFGGKKIPAGKGMVQIKTSPPGAEVIYKGRTLEQRTPFKVPLDPGNYRVTIKLKGYRPLQKDFAVLEGKSIDVIVELQSK